MADANTCELTASQPPKAASKKSFKLLLPEIKRELIKLRHNHDKHEPEYFASVKSLSDQELTSFDESDIVAVRAGRVAYGIIVFGKVRLQSSGKYIFVRWFVGGDDGKDEVDCKFHSFYTEEKPEADADDMCNPESIEDLVELRIQELQERGLYRTEYLVIIGLFRENMQGKSGRLLLGADHLGARVRWVAEERINRGLELVMGGEIESL